MPRRIRVGETVAFTTNSERHEGTVTAVRPEAGRMLAEVTTADGVWLMTLHGDDPRRAQLCSHAKRVYTLHIDPPESDRPTSGATP